VTEVDRVRRVVRAADGTAATYDRLLLCHRLQPLHPAVPGKDLPGVMAYRDIADTRP
jgi:nitrite reductase (NADH) large subunit